MTVLDLFPELNYCGLFLTFRCPLKCEYCINRYAGLALSEYEMSTEEWIDTINRIPMSSQLPGTLQGGEPFGRPDLCDIIEHSEGPFDLLTNGIFDAEEFANRISPDKFRKSLGKDVDAWFASIRISYHVRDWDMDNQNGYEDRLMRAVSILKRAGFKVGFTCPDNPKYQARIADFEKQAVGSKILFQRKEFLGYVDGKLHGTYKYSTGLSGKRQTCECRTTELLVAPDGMTYRCHNDLYLRQQPVGHILADEFKPDYKWRECENFGACSPCDLKSKTDRFGEMGHSSVEVRNFKHKHKPTGFAVGSSCSMSVGG